MSMEQLLENIRAKRNPTVMGLDPDLSLIPQQIREEALNRFGDTFEAAGEAIWNFNKQLIDVCADLIPAVKPQSAFYEMYGLPGLAALERTIQYAKNAGLYVILDGKRNDIGNTAKAYAAAFLGKTALFFSDAEATPVDALTVNPYLGFDGVEPFLKTAAEFQKAIFILVKTSNASSGDFQDIDAGGAPLYRRVAEKVELWGENAIGASGYSPCGAVVGATYPRQLAELRAAMPHTFFLIPGYGAQGGSAKDLTDAFASDGSGAVVNSSRGLIYAYRSKKDPLHFSDCTRAAVLQMKEDLLSVCPLS